MDNEQLNICVGARVMIAVNIDIFKKLINDSIGTVKHLDRKYSKPLWPDLNKM